VIVSVETIKFWILNYQREHSLNLPTSTQLFEYINNSNDTDVRRVYSRIEISKLLNTAVKAGVLYKIKEGKKLLWDVTMAAKPVNRKVVKEHKVWDGKLETWEPDKVKKDIWEPDKPEKSKDFWDGSREDIWEIKENK